MGQQMYVITLYASEYMWTHAEVLFDLEMFIRNCLKASITGTEHRNRSSVMC